jgi:hypothetical protein
LYRAHPALVGCEVGRNVVELVMIKNLTRQSNGEGLDGRLREGMRQKIVWRMRKRSMNLSHLHLLLRRPCKVERRPQKDVFALADYKHILPQATEEKVMTKRKPMRKKSKRAWR